MKRMEEMELPSADELLFMLYKEGAKMFACPLNVPLFGMSKADFVEGVELANPATYYKEIVVPADNQGSQFGQFDKNDNIYVQMRYEF